MAYIKISELPAADDPAGSDVLPIVQNDTTKKAALSLLPISADTQAALDLKASASDLTSHTGNTNNPHSVTKGQIGLSAVDNTSDADKPISTAAQTALNLKASSADLTSHVGDTNNPHQVTAAQLGAAVANGLATLDASAKLTASQIPDIAITDYLGSVANQAAMLALTGQKGDWCNRVDTGTVYIITGADPLQIGSWTQLTYPAAPVVSVNSKTGAVVLSNTDVGAAASNHAAQHKAAGGDPLYNQNLDTTDKPTFAGLVVNGTDTEGGVPPDLRFKGKTFFGNAAGTTGFIAEGGAPFHPANTFGFTGVNQNVTAYRPLGFTTGYFAQLVLNTDGNVGIGTSTPAAKLDVNGNLILRDVANAKTGTFDIQSKLSANRTFILPDADGTLALTSNILPADINSTPDTLMLRDESGNSEIRQLTFVDGISASSGYILYNPFQQGEELLAITQSAYWNTYGDANISCLSNGTQIRHLNALYINNNAAQLRWRIDTGSNNLVIGGNNTTDPTVLGTANTILGDGAGQSLSATSKASSCVFVGHKVGTICTASNITAIGYYAYNLGTGSACTAVGSRALEKSTGGNNVGIGNNAGNAITTGANNICCGSQAGSTTLTTGSNNTLVGQAANVGAGARNRSIALGFKAITHATLDGTLHIGGSGAGIAMENLTTSTAPTGALTYLRVWLNGTEYRIQAQAA